MLQLISIEKFERVLLFMFLAVMLSLCSTIVSFLHKFSYGWDVGVEGITRVMITQYGFPLGWYSRVAYDGHYVEDGFRSDVFVLDAIIYAVVFSLIGGSIFWIRNKRIAYRDVGKYFVHGIVFSIFLVVLTMIWTFVLVGLVAIGWIIGLAIGFGLLILIVGFINAVVTSFLWFPVKMSSWSLLGHGLILFIALIISDVFIVIVPTHVFPGTGTVVLTRIITSFLYGFVGKKVAGFWEETAPPSIPRSVEAEWRDKNL